MADFVPFVVDYPGLRGRLNQDRTWSFELRDPAWIDALPDEAFYLPRNVVDRLLDVANAPPCANGIPMSLRELLQIACEDSIVGEWCQASLVASGQCLCWASDELPPDSIDHYRGFYCHLTLTKN